MFPGGKIDVSARDWSAEALGHSIGAVAVFATAPATPPAQKSMRNCVAPDFSAGALAAKCCAACCGFASGWWIEVKKTIVLCVCVCVCVSRWALLERNDRISENLCDVDVFLEDLKSLGNRTEFFENHSLMRSDSVILFSVTLLSDSREFSLVWGSYIRYSRLERMLLGLERVLLGLLAESMGE